MSILKLDINETHSKNLSAGSVGSFCGSPIREMYTHEMELDQVVEVARQIEINRKLNPPSTVEVLPGELICDDNIVRRSSTAEAVGEAFYSNYVVPEGARKVTMAEAKELAKEGALIEWRPNRVVNRVEEFAVVYES